MNVTPVPKMIRNTPSSTSGFPMLEELCIATSSHSFMTDSDLNNVLHGSPHLRVLDLRGASRITATGLHALPFESKFRFWKNKRVSTDVPHTVVNVIFKPHTAMNSTWFCGLSLYLFLLFTV